MRKLGFILLYISVGMISFGIGSMIGEKIVETKCYNMPFNKSFQNTRCVRIFSKGE